MKNKRILHFLILLSIILIPISLYSQDEKINVKVIDQLGNPIPGVSVSIDGSKNYLTSANGNFDFIHSKKLKMPFKVTAEKTDYKIDQFIYLEEHREIEILLSKIEKQLKNDSVTNISINKKDPKNISDKIEENKKTINSNTEILVSNLEKEGSSFKQYKEDFDKIALEIVQERARLEKKILEINLEIEKIKSRLTTEKNLSQKERNELKKYLDHLESLLKENNLAFHKAEEKTRILINKLRMIILAKDSINHLAKLQIEKQKKEKEIAEKDFNRKLMIFTLATSILLLLTLLSYLIITRIRKQKKALEKANLDLNIVKKELIRNVVEVKNQKRLIEEQNAQLDAFVYKASHDIKGPLRSIIGLTQTGLKVINEAASLEFFDHILKSTQKLDNLLTDLLKVAKANQAEVQKSQINIYKAVTECISSFQNLNEFKSMRFNIQIDKNLEFNTDEKIFNSIVQNFIENGIKYKDDKKKESHLNIKSEKKDGKLILEFTDNGLGIDLTHQSKIFEMFYKVDPGSIGTGLGLHIIKLNVQKLKGSVGVSSQLGEGTSFYVTLNN